MLLFKKVLSEEEYEKYEEVLQQILNFAKSTSLDYKFEKKYAQKYTGNMSEIIGFLYHPRPSVLHPLPRALAEWEFHKGRPLTPTRPGKSESQYEG